MPKLNTRDLFITFDMGGCPNRCKHCWIGHTPNCKMDIKDIKDIVNQFKGWKHQGRDPYFEEVTVNTWYREPDYLDNYRELWDLEKDLSTKPLRFELMSIWRLARDDTYAKWAKEIGTEVCQITFFGLEEHTDYYTGRIGAFKDNLIATERLLKAGIIPRWQYFLNAENIEELGDFHQLIMDLKLEERIKELGSEFQCFVHTPTPDGEAFHLESIRPTLNDIKRIPDYFIDKTKKHYKTNDLEDVFGQTEQCLIKELEVVDKACGEYPNLAFVITPAFDVYTNLGEPLPWWSIGNIKDDSIDIIMERFLTDDCPGLTSNFKIPISNLAKRYGRLESDYMYPKDDLIRRWIRLWGEEYGRQISD